MDKKTELENLIKTKLHIETIDRDATLPEETKELKTVGEIFDLILKKFN